MFFATENTSILRDFVSISTWQSLVAVLLFVGIEIGFWILLKKFKIKFMYRILAGFAIGLVYGLVIQGIIGFPDKDQLEGYKDPEHNFYWVSELNVWAEFFKRIFINGVTLLTIPIVFIAIFKITAKPSSRGVARITLKGAALLLSNVAFAFAVTYALGIWLNVGVVKGYSLVSTDGGASSGRDNVPLPSLIWGYLPNNFFLTLTGTSIIPVMVLGALAGGSVKLLSRRKAVEMEAIRKAMDTGWDIIMSMLMTFMKIMPLAVMSMITVSITSRPIGMLAVIGKVIGIGYVGIAISIGWLTLLIFLSGMKVSGWWKHAWKPLVQGFATQSSNASLPITMGTLKEDLKVSENVTGTIAPISTTMGLMACAGVQAGLATSILWTGTGTGSVVHDMGFFSFTLLSLVITLIASLGIAGVPGTATVVTVGVLGGLGFIGFADSVLAIIAPLDGLFDMGRTGNNVLAAVAVAPIVAKSEGQIEEGSPLLSEKGILRQKAILNKINIKEEFAVKIENTTRTYNKSVNVKGIEASEKANLKSKYSEEVKTLKADKKAALLSAKQELATLKEPLRKSKA
ncbi:proton/glutamate symporter [Spiroplasma chinense]|uniref:L-cystine uptake protein TcyP n=1 Tax=Spiroplasma chinense TaxID=216932 RepID=A0A5B9Y3X0_9MOLU|nr:dicarboxylate/amino acid:cation symporter [Spiroplasma chinense]QEH61650.1 proton/glutamate symporter [Spiroplasma chinense]